MSDVEPSWTALALAEGDRSIYAVQTLVSRQNLADDQRLAIEGESKEREVTVEPALAGRHGPKSYYTGLIPTSVDQPPTCNNDFIR